MMYLKRISKNISLQSLESEVNEAITIIYALQKTEYNKNLIHDVALGFKNIVSAMEMRSASAFPLFLKWLKLYGKLQNQIGRDDTNLCKKFQNKIPLCTSYILAALNYNVKIANYHLEVMETCLKLFKSAPIDVMKTIANFDETVIASFWVPIEFVGDYRTQKECLRLIAFILQYYTNEEKQNQISQIETSSDLRELILKLSTNDDEFEKTSRELLNKFNNTTNNCSVFSVYCSAAVVGSANLLMPKHQDKFWIDFNYTSKSLSLFCQLQENAEELYIQIKIYKLQIKNNECIVCCNSPALFSTEVPNELKNSRIAVFTLPEKEIKRLHANNEILHFYNMSSFDSDKANTPGTIDQYLNECSDSEYDFYNTPITPELEVITNDKDVVKTASNTKKYDRKTSTEYADSEASSSPVAGLPLIENALSQYAIIKPIDISNKILNDSLPSVENNVQNSLDSGIQTISFATVNQDSFIFKKPTQIVRKTNSIQKKQTGVHSNSKKSQRTSFQSTSTSLSQSTSNVQKIVSINKNASKKDQQLKIISKQDTISKGNTPPVNRETENKDENYQPEELSLSSAEIFTPETFPPDARLTKIISSSETPSNSVNVSQTATFTTSTPQAVAKEKTTDLPNNSKSFATKRQILKRTSCQNCTSPTSKKPKIQNDERCFQNTNIPSDISQNISKNKEPEETQQTSHSSQKVTPSDRSKDTTENKERDPQKDIPSPRSKSTSKNRECKETKQTIKHSQNGSFQKEQVDTSSQTVEPNPSTTNSTRRFFKTIFNRNLTISPIKPKKRGRKKQPNTKKTRKGKQVNTVRPLNHLVKSDEVLEKAIDGKAKNTNLDSNKTENLNVQQNTQTNENSENAAKKLIDDKFRLDNDNDGSIWIKRRTNIKRNNALNNLRIPEFVPYSMWKKSMLLSKSQIDEVQSKTKPTQAISPLKKNDARESRVSARKRKINSNHETNSNTIENQSKNKNMKIDATEEIRNSCPEFRDFLSESNRAKSISFQAIVPPNNIFDNLKKSPRKAVTSSLRSNHSLNGSNSVRKDDSLNKSELATTEFELKKAKVVLTNLNLFDIVRQSPNSSVEKSSFTKQPYNEADDNKSDNSSVSSWCSNHNFNIIHSENGSSDEEYIPDDMMPRDKETEMDVSEVCLPDDVAVESEVVLNFDHNRSYEASEIFEEQMQSQNELELDVISLTTSSLKDFSEIISPDTITESEESLIKNNHWYIEKFLKQQHQLNYQPANESSNIVANLDTEIRRIQSTSNVQSQSRRPRNKVIIQSQIILSSSNIQRRRATFNYEETAIDNTGYNHTLANYNEKLLNEKNCIIQELEQETQDDFNTNLKQIFGRNFKTINDIETSATKIEEIISDILEKYEWLLEEQNKMSLKLENAQSEILKILNLCNSKIEKVHHSYDEATENLKNTAITLRNEMWKNLASEVRVKKNVTRKTNTGGKY